MITYLLGMQATLGALRSFLDHFCLFKDIHIRKGAGTDLVEPMRLEKGEPYRILPVSAATNAKHVTLLLSAMLYIPVGPRGVRNMIKIVGE